MLEYEVMIRLINPSDAAASSPLYSVGSVHTHEYQVDNLESSTDYTFRVRARTEAGWGAPCSEVVARTSPPARTLQPPKQPLRIESEEGEEVGANTEVTCTAVDLKLPPLRKGCTLDTGLSLEYRLPGEQDWLVYDRPALIDNNLDRLRIANLPHGRSTHADYRLRAHRGPLISEPSVVLKINDEDCHDRGPLRSSSTVLVALAIAICLLVLCVSVLRQAMRGQGSSNAMPTSELRGAKKQQMTRVRTTDEDDEEEDEEISVKYEFVNGRPVEGMLPLAGITTTAELLEELAEFGCELQDEVTLNVHHIEAWYEDRRGKNKQIGPRVPLDDVIDAGVVVVVEVRSSHVGVDRSRCRSGASRAAAKAPPTRAR